MAGGTVEMRLLPVCIATRVDESQSRIMGWAPADLHQLGITSVRTRKTLANLGLSPLLHMGVSQSIDIYGRRDTQSVNMIQAGAWSLAFSSPRTHRSTPPCTSRSHTVGERRK